MRFRTETFGAIRTINGDSAEVLKTVPDASVDSVVTDPPYALVSIGKRFGADNAAPAKAGKSGAYARASAGFMGQKWDTGETAFAVEFWQEVLRVLKPGGHVLAFGGTRTYHRLVCAIEDAGFEIRDQIAWLYGAGFPKSHNVREKGWAGWGTALKPALEPIVLARKPLAGTVAANVLQHGTGALNIGACRVGSSTGQRPNGECTWEPAQQHCDTCAARAERSARPSIPETRAYTATSGAAPTSSARAETPQPGIGKTATGCSDGTRADDTATSSNTGASGNKTTARSRRATKSITETKTGETTTPTTCASCGGLITAPHTGNITPANRNSKRGGFSNAPAGREGERSANRRYSEAGSTDFAATPGPRGGSPDGRWPANVIHDGSEEVVGAFPERDGAVSNGRSGDSNGYGGGLGKQDQQPGFGDSGSAARFFYSAKADAEDRLGSKHPTVKPADLMAYLCRLVTPPGGTVLDPFAGSGSTGVACVGAGFAAILIEREETYFADIGRRIAWAQGNGGLTAQEIVRGKQVSADGLPLFSEQGA